MAPAASKKGSRPAPPARDRRSSSRQSTPLSPLAGDSAPPTPLVSTPTSAAAIATANTQQTPSPPKDTAYIHTATSSLISSDPAIEMLISRISTHPTNPPPAKGLHTLHDRIKDGALKVMTRRSEVCDRSMRQLVQKRKERLQLEQERELAAVDAARVKEEEGERRRAKKEKEKEKNGKKRSAEEMEGGGEDLKERRDSLPSVGAHGVARQDGVGVGEGAPPPPSPVISPKKDAMDLMDTADSHSDSDLSRTDAPSTAPLYERAFGKDPTSFDDPTVYDIKDITDEMTDEQKRDILNVAQWPESDLKDLTAGDPPDMDFSNPATKPANQIAFSTFQTYVEPYIRPFTEEDVAFLKDRADRVTPYLIPQKGNRTYKEVWAAEDGNDGIAPPRKQEMDPNEARGNFEDLTPDVHETDEISMGPIMNRLLSIIRPAPSQKKDTGTSSNNKDTEDVDGDTSMLNGDLTAEPSQDLFAQAGAADGDQSEIPKPPTLLPPEAPRPLNLSTTTPDYASLDQRALQELRHIGFLSTTDTLDYSAHADDEVSARLRTLQHELRRVSRFNNVRKLRVLELTEERMAMQEYSNIADDLDNQVNAAYLKRNRSLSKPNSKKGGSSNRPSAAAAAALRGVAGARGVSEGVRALMQKRRDWIDMVGPVVGYGRPGILGEGETVWGETDMKRLERVEREVEGGEEGGE